MVLGCRCDTWSPGHPGPGSTHYPQGPDEHSSKHEAQITTPAKTQRHKPSCRVSSRPFLCTISRTLHNLPKAPWEILICVVAPKTNTLRSCSCSLVPVGEVKPSLLRLNPSRSCVRQPPAADSMQSKRPVMPPDSPRATRPALY